MAYTLANWACVSTSLNQGQEVVVPFGGSSTVLNAPNFFVYGSPNDTVAQIAAANYFLPEYASLCVGDIIMGSGTDASFALVVATVSSSGVTTASMGLTTSIGTANIQDGAITNAKVNAAAAVDYSKLAAMPTGSILLGNAGVPTATALSGDLTVDATGVAALGTNVVGSSKLALSVLQYTAVAVTAAQFNGMYAAPKLLVPAAGPDTLLVLDKVDLLMTYGSANYAAGGVAAVQYDSTANGAGVIASSTLSAATFQAAASTGFVFNGGVVPQTFSTCVNKGLYLSNISGAFTTGDSPMVAHCWYKVIPTV